MKTKTFLFSLIVVVLSLISCSSSNIIKTSSPWKNFKAPKNYVYVPSGQLKTSMGSISVKGFYMSKAEISNLDYNEFLADLKKQNRTEDLKIAQRHPEKWNHEAFRKNYHLQPSYLNYPVLTISKAAAELYCKWLKEKWQSKYPNHNIHFRLPLEYEWVYAAKGGHENFPYPWGSNELRNDKGLLLANFKRMGSQHISYDRKNKTYKIKAAEIAENKYSNPAPVISFLPNNYGLFHMSGNAAEMVFTNSIKIEGGHRTKGGCYDSTGWDIQIEGPDEFEGWTEPSQYIGFRPIMTVR